MDFHTHNLNAPAREAIINIPKEGLLHPADFRFLEGRLYSAGIHPWWTADEDVLRCLQGLEKLLEREEVVAVGECGIDRLRGAAQPVQEAIFRQQALLAEAHALPVTIHCVKAFDVVLRLKKALRPTTAWTIHGFRGKPALARQLLEAGFDLSFGTHYNPASLAVTPPARRHFETDEDFPR